MTSTAGEFATGWRVLLAAVIGISMATTAIPFYSMGVFIAPLEQAKGWQRSEIAIAATVLGFALPVAFLGLGWLINRFGVRLTATVGHFMLGLAFLGLSQVGGDLNVFLALYAFGAIAAIGASPVTYTRAIVQLFHRHRGLAIGIAMSGTGIGAAVAPPLLESVIRLQGWQAGYQTLALMLFVVGATVYVLLGGTVFAKHVTPQTSVDTAPTPPQSRRDWALLGLICVMIFAISIAVNGYVVHLVPILAKAGLTSQEAAALAASIGLAVIVGRLVTGSLLDRLSTGLVGCAIFAAAAAGIYMLGISAATAPLVPILVIGFTVGAEVDIVAYLVSKQFDQRNYARNFSWVYGVFMAGAGLSPLIAARMFDRAGDYAPFFLFSIVLLAGVSLSFLTLHVLQQRSITRRTHV